MQEVTAKEMLERLNNDIACVVQRKLELIADGYDKAAECCDKNIQVYKAIHALIAAHVEPHRVTRGWVEKWTKDLFYADWCTATSSEREGLTTPIIDMLSDLGIEVEEGK